MPLTERLDERGSTVDISSATVSRRSFLTGTLALGAAGASALSLVGCAPRTTPGGAESNDTPVLANTADWLGSAPETPSDFSQELEADVVVVGLGMAGICATRAAVEEGARVVVFEKGAGFGLTSKNIHAWGSKTWLTHFPECEKFFQMRDQMISHVVKGCLSRVDGRIHTRWCEENGDAFDWFLGAVPEDEMFYGSAENNTPPDEEAVGIYETSYPYPANYNPLDENYPCFPGTAKTNPNTLPFFEANMRIAEETAAGSLTILRSTPAIKLLIAEDGSIAGVVAQDAEGAYVKATAKSVVLATGDFLSNDDMVQALIPRVYADGHRADTDENWYSVSDATGKKCNTGDGHRMGLWAGARMQSDGCCMSHLVGGGAPLGTMPYLWLNTEGKRFMNEDVQGQQFAEQVREQPNMTAYQLYDAKWESEAVDLPYGHGKNPAASAEAMEKAVADGRVLRADTLEELLDAIDIDKKEALASIERYNSLCAEGIDRDFAKTPRRLFPLSEAPFYCVPFGKGDDLVTMSGLESDEDCHVYNDQLRVIPGLYAAGNVQGNRYAFDYPEVLQGHSVAMAMTFGRIAGRNAARAI